MNRQALYFDDLQVGDTSITGTYEVSAAAIKRFAAEFDPQPFHLDEEAARGTMFGGLAASGWHTAAITMRLLVSEGPKLINGVLGAGAHVEWKTPTRPGDILHVESEVVELIPSRSRTDRGTVALRSKTINQHGQIVQDMTAKLIVARRPA
ncbi:MaoC family dehydratase [Paraburkholderia sp. BR13439]|uniref:MaoC family dehydratase n=1 Tax=Paraburkholderia sp. BR13439 TaxID=3236996 RepID=UPI0034CE33D0